jgi:hypothetical protein
VLRSIPILLIALPFFALIVCGAGIVKENPFLLSCTAFSADTTPAELVARYGSSNVRSDKIYIGEGEYENGTVLYSDEPKRRAEFLRREQEVKRAPRMIRITGTESQWQTSQGLTLGLTLRTVEKIN